MIPFFVQYVHCINYNNLNGNLVIMLLCITLSWMQCVVDKLHSHRRHDIYINSSLLTSGPFPTCSISALDHLCTNCLYFSWWNCKIKKGRFYNEKQEQHSVPWLRVNNAHFYKYHENITGIFWLQKSQKSSRKVKKWEERKMAGKYSN